MVEWDPGTLPNEEKTVFSHDGPRHSLVIIGGVRASHCRSDFNNANIFILPPSLLNFGGKCNAAPKASSPFRNLDKNNHVAFDFTLEEYQVRLAGVLEGNPACFHREVLDD